MHTVLHTQPHLHVPFPSHVLRHRKTHGHLEALTGSYLVTHVLCTTPRRVDTGTRTQSHTPSSADTTRINMVLTGYHAAHQPHTRLGLCPCVTPAGHSCPLSHTGSASRTNTSSGHTPTHSQLDKHLHACAHTRTPRHTPLAHKDTRVILPPQHLALTHPSLTREPRPCPHSGGAGQQ